MPNFAEQEIQSTFKQQKDKKEPDRKSYLIFVDSILLKANL